MRLVNADALAMKLRHMGYMDENEEIQKVIDRFEEECDGDLISRRAAIRIAEQGQIQGYPWQFEQLVKLPSAEPERTAKVETVEKPNVFKCGECGQYKGRQVVALKEEA